MSKELTVPKPPIIEGTLVTVVFTDHCLLTRVVKSDLRLTGYFRVACDGSPIDVLQISDEGISWLRGHHLPSSHEVEAAVTAAALRAPASSEKSSSGSSVNFGGFGDVLLGALAGAAGALALRSVKKSQPTAPTKQWPTRVYKKKPLK